MFARGLVAGSRARLQKNPEWFQIEGWAFKFKIQIS